MSLELFWDIVRGRLVSCFKNSITDKHVDTKTVIAKTSVNSLSQDVFLTETILNPTGCIQALWFTNDNWSAANMEIASLKIFVKRPHKTL